MKNKIIELPCHTKNEIKKTETIYELKENIINFEMYRKYSIILITC